MTRNDAIDALEVKNLITRNTDLSDERRIFVALTDDGKKYVERINL